jgi:hypothetical protein
MHVLEKRLRRLEVGLLPPPETAQSQGLREIVRAIRRRRAARHGLPEPDKERSSHQNTYSFGW